MSGFPRQEITLGDAMPVDVSGTLRQALARLVADKARIERQIMGLQQALGTEASLDGQPVRRRARAKHGRRRMSPAERQAVSARMKAFWAKRRAGARKRKRRKR
jgi:hypothetical protein